jgi:phosphoadenosine phosphosulfate reductase
MFPKFKDAYIRAFQKMLEERKRRGLLTQWETGVDVFHWWMEDGILPGQEVLEEFEE